MTNTNSRLSSAKATATKAAAKTANARVSTTNAPPIRGMQDISCPIELLSPLVSAHREAFKSQRGSLLADIAANTNRHRKLLREVGSLLLEATQKGHHGLANSQVAVLTALMLCEDIDYREEHISIRVTKGMTGFKLDIADGPTALRLQAWDFHHPDCLSHTVFEMCWEKVTEANPDVYPWALGLIRSVLESPTHVHMGFSDCQGLIGYSH